MKIKIWILPFVFASAIFFIAKPIIAQTLTEEERMIELLHSGEVITESQVGENGFSQIYYLIDDNKRFITDTNYTNTDPFISGEYITWMGQTGSNWQIFFHHVPTNTTTQLTFSGNNVNPKIDSGNLVWEGWKDNAWQIFFFDGKSIKQLTSGRGALNVGIDDDIIFYASRDGASWKATIYSIVRDEKRDVSVGPTAKNPKVIGEKIYLTEEEFPLLVEDFFLLDLPPLSSSDSPEIVTEEEIIEELEATPSADLEL